MAGMNRSQGEMESVSVKVDHGEASFSMRGILSEEAARWFEARVGAPTPVQREAWPAIASGEHVLVSAPTGAGKTLAAFLVWIDRLKAEAERGELSDGVRVIYISPLKSLAADIRENLERPLAGIGADMLRVGVRTGDTPASERQRMLRRPPHIFITTPESLYILLTTRKGREMLRTARVAIIDELHALISGKRGAHLMLSLARLDALAERPLQRVGLSATIRPLDAAADYLAPGEPVRIVAPAMEKRADIAVTGVLPDMRVLPQGTIWPELARRVAALCEGRRTVIAFLEGRAQAERLAAAVNDIAGEGFALTHHGSVSREKRQEAEAALRSGRLRLLCATSSMELGIDVGEVDLVVQVGCPLTVSAALQRMGRAGHNPGRVSVMHIFPKTASDGLWCGLTADAALDGAIERARPPRGCLDVLAQHLVSMAADGGYTVDDALAIARRAFPTRDVTRAEVTALLEMLSGDWEHAQDKPARPRLLYDRIHGTVTGDRYTRLLALSAGGAIPDRGLYPCVLRDGTRVGELDEEFVFEARIGDRFLLGAFAWRIEEVTRDRVIVSPAAQAGAQAPFWRGDGAGRDYAVSLRFGEALRRVDASEDPVAALEALRLDESAALNAARHVRDQLAATGCLPDDRTILLEHFSDEAGEHQLMVHSIFGRRVNDALALLLQRAAAQASGVDIKAWDDDNGILLYAMGARAIPDGLLHSLDPAQAAPLLRAMLPATPLFAMAFRYNAGRALMMGARSGRRQALWVQRLRGAEALSLAVGDARHPLMRETLRECLDDYLDLDALIEVLEGVRSGRIAVREMHVETPSPMALPMRRQAEAEMMYDYAPIPKAAARAAEQAVQAALRADAGIIPDPALLRAQCAPARRPENPDQLHSLMMTEGDFAVGEVDAPMEWLEALRRAGRATRLSPARCAAFSGNDAADGTPAPERGPSTDHRAVPVSDITAPMIDEEHSPDNDGISAAESGVLPRPASSSLDAARGSAAVSASGIAPALWIATEHAGDYRRAANGDGDARAAIARRCLRHRGPQDAETLSLRYGWDEADCAALLEALCADGIAVALDGRCWHGELYARAQRQTLLARRKAAQTLPPERYAALLARNLRRPGRPADQLREAIEGLVDLPFPLRQWEDQLLPARVSGYQPAMLDALIARGEFIWRVESGALAFHRAEDIDWDAPPCARAARPDKGAPHAASDPIGPSEAGAPVPSDAMDAGVRSDGSRAATEIGPTSPLRDAVLDAPENRGAGFAAAPSELARQPAIDPRTTAARAGHTGAASETSSTESAAAPASRDAAAVLDALEKRGASFASALSGLTRQPVIDVLLDLAARGLVCADSFAPLRALMALEDGRGRSPRQLARVRAAAAQAGRWSLTRPIRARSDEALLALDFAQHRLVCRETALRVPWARALELLRGWELSGKARRGYFVAGLSGIQFILDSDYGAVAAALSARDGGIAWLHANDPAQAWGRLLPHAPERAFLCVPGSAVALVDGRPAAVLEQGGKRLRLFEPDAAEPVLSALARDFRQGFVYADRDRLLLRDVPPSLAAALESAGWTREALDWVVWKRP